MRKKTTDTAVSNITIATISWESNLWLKGKTKISFWCPLTSTRFSFILFCSQFCHHACEAKGSFLALLIVPFVINALKDSAVFHLYSFVNSNWSL